MKELQRLKELQEEANKTNSTNEKKVIVTKYPDLKEIFRYTLDGTVQFGVTSENLKKRDDIDPVLAKDFENIFSLLEALSKREITGHTAMASVQEFIKKNKEFETQIFDIIDKNLKIRISETVINKIWPGCVPTFDVALADKYEAKKKKVNFEKDVWFSARKLDGVRTLAFIDNEGKASFMSRSGKPFETLGKVKEDLEKLCSANSIKNVVFDGEGCVVDENGDEDFASIIKLIKKKDFTIPNPKYKIFDLITREEFDKKIGTTIFMDRTNHLKTLVLRDQYKTLDLVEQIRVKSNDHFEELRKESREKLWEGLILRKNYIYEGKRSESLLKVKDFLDGDYIVETVTNGPQRFIENGLEVERDLVSNLVIFHKGNEVGVGSGLTLQQRKDWYENPNLIIGKKITVKYFEETIDQDGKYSLRFPIFKGIRDYENEEEE